MTLAVQPRRLVVSIVSHGHGAMVQRLLEQLARSSAAAVTRVVVTHNIPEDVLHAPAEGWPFRVDTIVNETPRGFGANHNGALQGAHESFVCVLNPDVEILQDEEPFASLVSTAAQPDVGCAYPVQLDYAGVVQDSERELPSPAALWSRRVLGRPQRRIDWVNAACLVIPLHVWTASRGFDEGYFMYCEDVDLCLRIRLLGWELRRAPARVVHAGSRASNRQWRHLAWHIRSLLRLWFSAPYRLMGKYD